MPVRAQTCVPLSTAACGSIGVSTTTPYRLDFSSPAGGLSGTGFTAVLAPSRNRYPAAPSDPAVPGYEPTLINVAGGVLTLTTTRGSLFQTQNENAANNTQVNALAVGFDATSPRIVRVRLLNPEFPDTANGEHAGLWFGLNEDNYVRLAVINRTGAGLGTLELRREVAGASSTNATNVATANLAVLDGSIVTLELLLDPANARVWGRYVSTNGEAGVLGPLSIPASFFSGSLLPDGSTGPLSLAGILTSSRSNTVTPALPFRFDDFELAPPGAAPVAVADEISVLSGGASSALVGGQTSLLANDTDSDGDSLSASLVSGPSHGVLTLSADGTFSYVNNGGSATTDSFTYRVNDGLLDSDPQTVSIVITPVCGGIGIGACSALPVTVSSTRTLTFSGGAGGLADTGFTIVQRPSVNRYPATPSLPSVPGYEPSLITVSGGLLTLTSTRGSFFQTPAQNTANNTQVNALALPFRVGSESLSIGVDVVRPVLRDTANGEAAGLWFGLGEDDYIRLAVLNRNGADLGQIELRREVGGVSSTASDLQLADVTALSSSVIKLELRIDPVSRAVSGVYTSTSGESGLLGPLTVPASFISGTLLADGATGPVSFGGVFATGRFNTLSTPVFSFDNFTVGPLANTPPIAAGDRLGVAAAGGAQTALVGGASSVLANDVDNEGDALTAVLVSGPSNGVVTLNSDGTFTYTHDGGSSESDSFTYRASDGFLSSSDATVTIVIGDTEGPRVVAVTAPPNGDYGVGDPVEFSVRFDEAVTVDLSGGAPRLVLTLDSGQRHVDYISGSGSDTLLFRLTVGSTDLDQDGPVLASMIDLNGARLFDLIENAADPTLNNPASLAGIRIGNPDVPPSPVPTMTEWAMILLGAILAGGGAFHIQRRKCTA